MFDQAEVFANTWLANGAEDTSDDSLKFEGKLGYQLGGRYQWDEMRAFVSLKQGDWEIKESGSMREGSFREFIAGVGYVNKVTKSQTLLTRLNFFQEKAEVKYLAGATEVELKRIPLVFAYEVAVTDWLTLRGSVSHNFYGKRETKNLANVPNMLARMSFSNRYNGNLADSSDRKEDLGDSTSVSAGATFNFGQLKVDGVVGTSGNDGVHDGDENGVFSLDRLLTRVSMTYHF